jgi:hypothetical protein
LFPVEEAELGRLHVGGNVFRASGLAGFGNVMGTDLIFSSERVNNTKVASRKKTTSMSGMISMRAFLDGVGGKRASMCDWVKRLRANREIINGRALARASKDSP